MNICRLNRSSKVCLEKGPARHTRIPLSSFTNFDFKYSVEKLILKQESDLKVTLMTFDRVKYHF